MAMLENQKESPEQRANYLSRGLRFLRDVRSELTRVTWPSRREVYATTIVVILTSMVFGTYLYVVDLGLSSLVDWIFVSRKG